jgi:hypothetical protein
VTSAEVFRNVARVVGQMALQQQVSRVSRAMIIAWAETLESAAAALRRMAG